VVIDLQSWRRLRITHHALDYLDRFGAEVSVLEQEALNSVVRGQFVELDFVWNSMNYFTTYAYAGSHIHLGDDARIRHFEGRRKPWAPDTGALADEIALEWYVYLDRTSWRGWRPVSWNRDWERRLDEHRASMAFSANRRGPVR